MLTNLLLHKQRRMTRQIPLLVMPVIFMLLFAAISFSGMAQTVSANCSGAASITIGTCTSDQNFADATVNDPTPTGCVTSFTRDGWFKFTANATTRMSVLFTNSSTRDGALYVYSGSCAGLTVVACANNNNAGGDDESVTFAATNGSTYWVRVGRTSGTNGASLSGTICVNNLADAANDCAAALTLTQTTSYSGTNFWLTNATQSIAALNCASSTSSSALDVWFKFIAGSANPSIRVTGGPNFDAVIDLRSGACNGSNISCADAQGDAGTETLVASGLTIGATYYVRVYDYNSSGSAISPTQEFQVGIFGACATPAAPTSGGNISICTNATPGTISATAPTGHVVDWYSAATGGTLLQSASNNFNSSTSGTYYAQSRNAVLGCTSTSRTAVTLTVNPLSVGGSIAGGTTVCSGSNSGNLTLSGHTGSVTKWQYSLVNDFSSGITDIANVTTSQAFNNLTATRYYRAVVTSGSCAAANSTIATVNVTPTSTIVLTSGVGTNVQTTCINNAITTITYAIGGTATGAALSGGSLPAGVTGSYNSGTGIFSIEGTASVSGNFSYTITASGPCPVTASGTINVNANSTLTFTSAAGTDNQTKCVNTAINNITYLVGGGGTGASAAGLPNGVTGTYNTGTKIFTISGSATVAGIFSYTVTTAGPCVNTSLGGTITVTGNATLALSSAAGTNVQTVCSNTPIGNIIYTAGGTATGVVATGLPAGVNGDYNAGIFTISGIPAAAGIFNYTVTTTGPCVNPSFTGTITSNTQPTAVNVSPSSTTICLGTNVPLTATATNSSLALSNDNFTGTPTYTTTGSVAGGNSQVWTKETSGTNVNTVGTFTSPNGGGIMIAVGGAQCGFSSCTSSASTILTSPVINTNNYSTLTLTYNHCYKQANVSGSGTVQVSTDNTNWVTIKTYTTNQGTGTGFLADNISLSNTYLNQSNLRIRFNFVSSGSSGFLGSHSAWWAVDDVTINAVPLPLYSWTANTAAGVNGLPLNAGNYLTSNINIIVTPTATTTYTLTAKDPVTNCVSNLSVANAIVHVNNVTAGAIAGAQTICYGGNPDAFTSATDGTGEGAITYRWEKTVSPFTSWNIISGATSAGFDASLLTSTTRYRRVSISTLNTIACEAISNELIVTVPTAALNATVAFTNITCNGLNNGTITISNPVGGFGSYEYSINAGTSWEIAGNYTSLQPGTYHVQIRDAAHTACFIILDNSLVINEPALINASALLTTAIQCYNGTGTVTITAAGGTGQLQYTFNAQTNNTGIFNGIAAGVNLPYSVTDANSCTAATGTITVTEPAEIPAPISGGNQAVCDNGNPAQTLTASATSPFTINWYDAATNGNIVTPVQSGVGTVTYYAEAFDGTCSSLTRTAVSLTINSAPTAITNNQSVCYDGNPGQTLTASATGGTITWYDAATNGNVVTPVQTGVGTSTYYAEAFNGNCASVSRAVAVLTINPAPDAPVSGGNQTVCEDGNPSQILTATATGGTLTWYDAATNGNVVTPVQVGVGSSTYYAIASDGTCFSLDRTPLTLTINPAPAPPAATNQTVCEDGNPAQTLTATATGGTITWYDAATNGNVVTPVQTGVGSATYYAASSNGICPSLSRTAVILTINAAPAAPVSGGNQTVCSDGNPAQTLTATATGVTITWYDAPTNGNVVTPVQTGVGTVTYYASASNGICESLTRTAVTLTINPLPATATLNVIQPDCGTAAGSITVTAPTGAEFTYSIGGIYQSSPTFTGLSAGTYNVTVQNSFGCISAAGAIATINPQPFIPGAPVVTGIVNVCPYIGSGEQITYTASVAGATSYNWILPPNVILQSGGGTNSINVTFNTGFGTQPNKQIRVTAISACGISAQTIYYLVAQYPGTPGVISGQTDICSLIGTANTATYKINKVNAATSYVWSTQSGTTSVTHPAGTGLNDTIIVVTYAAGFSSSPITVIAVNGCGTSGSVRSLFIPRTSASTPGLISGPTNVCANILPSGNAATYSILHVIGATSYTWSVPLNSIVTHPNGLGANDFSITVQYPAGFTNGTISVSATNGCGTSGLRTLSITKLNPATPSIIDVIQLQSCPNRVYSYTLSALPSNSTSVEWGIPTAQGAIKLSETSTSITVSYPATAVLGTVTAQSFNSCGSSSIRSTSVRLPACPPVEDELSKGSSTQFAKISKQALPLVSSMDVSVFPNPSVNDFNLKVVTAEKETINVRILDMQGRELKRLTIQPRQTIQLGAELKTGSYLIETRQADKLKTVKVIKF